VSTAHFDSYIPLFYALPTVLS